MTGKHLLSILFWVGTTVATYAQMPLQGALGEEQQEILSEERPEQVEAEPGTDAGWLYRLQHPLNINAADSLDWMELGILSPQQVSAILRYRATLGPFLDVYELQAVPALPTVLLLQLQQVVTVVLADRWQTAVTGANWLTRFSGGSSAVRDAKSYGGSPMQWLSRYRLRRADWQAGVLAEQDAGEAFQKTGADFYSAFVARQSNQKPVNWWIGDYVVSFGQGLVLGQQFGGNRSAYPNLLVRAPEGIRPYRGTGEFNFFRGGALAYRWRGWQASIMLSHRKFDASMRQDSSSGDASAGSLYMTGLHRSAAERARRGNLALNTGGWMVNYTRSFWQVGALWLSHQLSRSMQAFDHPRNRYAFSGRNWHGISVYGRLEWQNMLVVSEWVMSTNRRLAGQVGITASLHKTWDASLFFRHASPGFTAWFGSGMGAQSRFINETGLLAAWVFRPSKRFELSGYADRWWHPWMRYLVDFPSNGHQVQVQALYTPSKTARWQVAFRQTEQTVSTSENGGPLPALLRRRHAQWRLLYQADPSRGMQWRLRAVANTVSFASGRIETGVALAAQVRFQLWRKRLGIQAQYATHRVSDFQAAVYLRQPDLPGLNSLAFLNGEGERLVLVADFKLSSRWRVASIFAVSASRQVDFGVEDQQADSQPVNNQWRLQFSGQF